MAAQVPFSMAKIDHVVLRAQNLPRMVAFYRDVLGCPVAREYSKSKMYSLRAGASLIDIADINGPIGSAGGAPPGKEGHNVDHIAIRIDPFDEETIRSYLEAHDVETEPAAKRFGADDVGLSMVIRDPEGNKVELKGPPL